MSLSRDKITSSGTIDAVTQCVSLCLFWCKALCLVETLGEGGVRDLPGNRPCLIPTATDKKPILFIQDLRSNIGVTS